MKKTVSIALSLIFLVSTFGFSLVVGYCPMSKTYTLSFSGKPAACCCSNSTGRGCCKSHTFQVKKIEDNYTASGCPLHLAAGDVMISRHPSVIVMNSWQHIQPGPFACDPPPEPPVPLSILYRSIQV